MSVIIRLQGLPWSASAMDIRQFFKGLNIPPGGVHIIGGDKGDAFIAFVSDEDARKAMMLNNGYIDINAVQLFLSSKTEMQNVIGEAKNQSAPPPPEQSIQPQQTPPQTQPGNDYPRPHEQGYPPQDRRPEYDRGFNRPPDEYGQQYNPQSSTMQGLDSDRQQMNHRPYEDPTSRGVYSNVSQPQPYLPREGGTPRDSGSQNGDYDRFSSHSQESQPESARMGYPQDRGQSQDPYADRYAQYREGQMDRYPTQDNQPRPGMNQPLPDRYPGQMPPEQNRPGYSDRYPPVSTNERPTQEGFPERYQPTQTPPDFGRNNQVKNEFPDRYPPTPSDRRYTYENMTYPPPADFDETSRSSLRSQDEKKSDMVENNPPYPYQSKPWDQKGNDDPMKPAWDSRPPPQLYNRPDERRPWDSIHSKDDRPPPEAYSMDHSRHLPPSSQLDRSFEDKSYDGRPGPIPSQNDRPRYDDRGRYPQDDPYPDRRPPFDPYERGNPPNQRFDPANRFDRQPADWNKNQPAHTGIDNDNRYPNAPRKDFEDRRPEPLPNYERSPFSASDVRTSQPNFPDRGHYPERHSSHEREQLHERRPPHAPYDRAPPSLQDHQRGPFHGQYDRPPVGFQEDERPRVESHFDRQPLDVPHKPGDRPPLIENRPPSGAPIDRPPFGRLPNEGNLRFERPSGIYGERSGDRLDVNRDRPPISGRMTDHIEPVPMDIVDEDSKKLDTFAPKSMPGMPFRPPGPGGFEGRFPNRPPFHRPPMDMRHPYPRLGSITGFPNTPSRETVNPPASVGGNIEAPFNKVEQHPKNVPPKPLIPGLVGDPDLQKHLDTNTGSNEHDRKQQDIAKRDDSRTINKPPTIDTRSPRTDGKQDTDSRRGKDEDSRKDDDRRDRDRDSRDRRRDSDKNVRDDRSRSDVDRRRFDADRRDDRYGRDYDRSRNYDRFRDRDGRYDRYRDDRDTRRSPRDDRDSHRSPRDRDRKDDYGRERKDEFGREKRSADKDSRKDTDSRSSSKPRNTTYEKSPAKAETQNSTTKSPANSSSSKSTSQNNSSSSKSMPQPNASKSTSQSNSSVQSIPMPTSTLTTKSNWKPVVSPATSTVSKMNTQVPVSSSVPPSNQRSSGTGNVPRPQGPTRPQGVDPSKQPGILGAAPPGIRPLLQPPVPRKASSDWEQRPQQQQATLRAPAERPTQQPPTRAPSERPTQQSPSSRAPAGRPTQQPPAVNTSKQFDAADPKGLKRQYRQSTPSLSIVVKNLPSNAGYRDVRKFFQGCEIPWDGLKMINDDQGKRIGVAYINFCSSQAYYDSLEKNKGKLNDNVIEVKPCSLDEYEKAIDSYIPGKDNDAKKPRTEEQPKTITKASPQKPNDNIVQVRGWASSVTTDELKKFFKDLKVSDNGNAIVIEHDHQKRPTGMALVKFDNEADFKKALDMNMKQLSGKNVHIRSASQQDFQNLIEDQKKIGTLPSVLKESIGNKTSAPKDSGAGGDALKCDYTCVHLQGLPSYTTLQDVQFTFLAGLEIGNRGIHLVLDSNGKSLGEAFAEFSSETDCAKALKKTGETFMGRKIIVRPIMRTEMLDMLRMIKQPSGRHSSGPQFGRRSTYYIKTENWPFTISIREVLSFFQGFNPIQETVRVQIGNDMQGSAAMVGFRSHEDAERAVQTLNNKFYRQRPIRMDVAHM